MAPCTRMQGFVPGLVPVGDAMVKTEVRMAEPAPEPPPMSMESARSHFADNIKSVIKTTIRIFIGNPTRPRYASFR